MIGLHNVGVGRAREDRKNPNVELAELDVREMLALRVVRKVENPEAANFLLSRPQRTQQQNASR